jgi:large subunit ribosomal protein L30
MAQNLRNLVGKQATITQTRSIIGGLKNQEATLKTLGLRKIGQSTTREVTPAVYGMIKTVEHLVDVEEVAG